MERVGWVKGWSWKRDGGVYQKEEGEQKRRSVFSVWPADPPWIRPRQNFNNFNGFSVWLNIDQVKYRRSFLFLPLLTSARFYWLIIRNEDDEDEKGGWEGGWSIILVIYSICGGWAPILNSNTRAAKWKCLPVKITFQKPNLPQCQNLEGSSEYISRSISSTYWFPKRQCWWQFTLPWAIRAPIEGGGGRTMVAIGLLATLPSSTYLMCVI